MLVSLKALSKYVDLKDLTPSQIADGLTFSGVEIEEFHQLANATNLVIGEIIECEMHPDSDHLHVLKVDLGNKYGVNQIVCGAPNARKGLKVIVAREGAILPGGTIKKGIIRGVESNGMCCSLLELGVESKYLTDKQINGIEELDASAPVGEENVLSYLGLDDVVFDAKILANRPDLLSIRNFAKEVSAVFKLKFKDEQFSIKSNIKNSFFISSKTNKCSQFASREIKNIVIKPSPKWIQDILMASGIRSINNIVDIGNYVMLMTGQPLHMYDIDKLNKKELYASSSYSGDFVALDEKTYSLYEGDIVICSDGEVMCLGGVMGSLKCAVDENSKNIAIESASFDGASIRRTSSRLGLVSESSQRFVKGTNHFQAEYVIDFATQLIIELCEGKEISDIVNYQSEEYKENIIETSVKDINKLLSTNFTFEQIKDVLVRLFFTVESTDSDALTIKVPSFRIDVESKADIAEEVIRILGYDNVESKMMKFDTTVGQLSPINEKINLIRNYLINNGFDECLTYSLISKKEVELFSELFNQEFVSVLHPLTDEHEVMRTSLTNSLCKCAEYNVARQNKNLSLFETSVISYKNGYSHHLSVVMVGGRLNQGYLSKMKYDFYDAKGIFEDIAQILGIDNSRFKFEKNDVMKELHPGRSAILNVQGKKIGFIGELHPNMNKVYDFNKLPVVVLEINLDELLSLKVSLNKMQQFSRFPSVTRDMSLLVMKNIEVKDIIRTIKSVGKGLVSDAYVFDVYEGENIDMNLKSVAISVVFTSNEHTLEEKEVNLLEDKIKFELNKTFKAVLRS
ncbi:MAG: phenylalanine--tRNA ligase subunit beta [Bacilli bacterium]